MKKEYRNSVRTKKMIRQAFVTLLGEKDSLESITVGELAKRADIAKSTFYNHYDDIYAVTEEFENELIEKLAAVFGEMEADHATEYEVYIDKVVEFLKANEDSYRKAICSSGVKYFIEKLKSIISQKLFTESVTLPFSEDKAERYVQIRFLTNACVDTIVDYFKGRLNVPLEEVGRIILSYLNKLKKE